MDYKKILRIIARAGSKLETVMIYYPRTNKQLKGWREVEPYSLSTDIGREGEHLIFNKDRISPGHIFNAYTINTSDDHCDSFIIGKIKSAKLTDRKFMPRNNWKVEF